eukprot:5758704-Pleurochrysis_carterae.AAC.1
MKFQVYRTATEKWVVQLEVKNSCSDVVQRGQNAPSRCLKRRAKFQWSAGSGREALPTYGLDYNCCKDALQAGLAHG